VVRAIDTGTDDPLWPHVAGAGALPVLRRSLLLLDDFDRLLDQDDGFLACIASIIKASKVRAGCFSLAVRRFCGDCACSRMWNADFRGDVNRDGFW
jgi:hypothetical protein